MILQRTFDRRNLLRGMLGGAAIGVGVPFLDCFLNSNGTALASGAPIPVCFGTWSWGLGFTPGRWEPKTVGPNYEMASDIAVLAPFKNKINVYSGMSAFLEGKAPFPHGSGNQVCLQGSHVGGFSMGPLPSIDVLVSGAIGARTRFRSLEVASCGKPITYSCRGGSVMNPSEISPIALYTRIFGPDFKDPNSAVFTPDPAIMLKRSALSYVLDQRADLLKRVGATDRARLDQYFTSLRELENQLDIQLRKPEPLAACSAPGKPDDTPMTVDVEVAGTNHRLFAGLLAHALACGQTQVINIVYSNAGSDLRKGNTTDSHHILSHEEPIDRALGYQPTVTWFSGRAMEAFRDLLTGLDAIREGDGTLLDRTLIYASTDVSYAKMHDVTNMPLFTAGSGGGRMKTGIHIQAKGDSVTRVGLTVQEAMGVGSNGWGTGENHSSKLLSEALA